MALTPAIFLDKDGTVLQDVPYNVEPVKMSFAAGAREGVARLGRLGVPLFIISNQPGVALGYFDPEALNGVRNRLEAMFLEVGAILQGFFYCPHHPKGRLAAYRKICTCRKPAPGLLVAAALDHSLDLDRSWFVGDILDDVEAGRRAGCQTVLIDNGNETEWRDGPLRKPDHTVADMDLASRIVAAAFASSPEGVNA